MITGRRWGTMAIALASAACGSTVIFGDLPAEDDGAGGTAGIGGSVSSSTADVAVSTTVDAVSTTTTSTSSAGGGGSMGIPDCVETEPVFEMPGLRPADIIVIIDNSGSMAQEANAVEQNINVNFAQIMAMSGVDYQVIMLTDHGNSSVEVCVGPPLSNTTDCNGVPGDVPNQFHHYDVNVQSFDSLCLALDTLYGANGGGEADEHGLHPDGWSKWLRSDAIKVFIEITDDDINCTWNGNNLSDNGGDPGSPTGNAAQAAIQFDSLLIGQASNQFGTQADRNYQFYSIVGIKEKANPLEPYLPDEPVAGTTQTDDCSTASGPGWGYQWLSKGTRGLRFPVCQFSSYDAVFQAIAAGVVEEVNAACTYSISAPGVVDLATLDVTYNPGQPMGPPEPLTLLPSPAACGASESGYYVANDKIEMCPATCERLREDPTHTIDVSGDCL